ncbi:hypothetical protein MTP02_59240 [Streptomyces albus]|nr:hypothetical protein MTP02_59240 [Streptomyces albus]
MQRVVLLRIQQPGGGLGEPPVGEAAFGAGELCLVTEERAAMGVWARVSATSLTTCAGVSSSRPRMRIRPGVMWSERRSPGREGVLCPAMRKRWSRSASERRRPRAMAASIGSDGCGPRRCSSRL